MREVAVGAIGSIVASFGRVVEVAWVAGARRVARVAPASPGGPGHGQSAFGGGWARAKLLGLGGRFSKIQSLIGERALAAVTVRKLCMEKSLYYL